MESWVNPAHLRLRSEHASQIKLFHSIGYARFWRDLSNPPTDSRYSKSTKRGLCDGTFNCCVIDDDFRILWMLKKRKNRLINRRITFCLCTAIGEQKLFFPTTGLNGWQTASVIATGITMWLSLLRILLFNLPVTVTFSSWKYALVTISWPFVSTFLNWLNVWSALKWEAVGEVCGGVVVMLVGVFNLTNGLVFRKV